MKIKEILSRPTTIDNIHESCFRSYGILRVVTHMIERGDSKETILELIEFLREHESDVNTSEIKRQSN